MNGPLDVAHQINDLVMGDPNADVLRGGHFEDQVYHNAFLTVLMRKEPLETFINYLGWDFVFQIFSQSSQIYSHQGNWHKKSSAIFQIS